MSAGYHGFLNDREAARRFRHTMSLYRQELGHFRDVPAWYDPADTLEVSPDHFRCYVVSLPD
jgi:hypothetical protein